MAKNSGLLQLNSVLRWSIVDYFLGCLAFKIVRGGLGGLVILEFWEVGEGWFGLCCGA